MAKTSDQLTYDHVRQRSQMLFFELKTDGRIIEANTYAESVIDIPLAKQNFQDIVVDFIGSFSLSLLIQEPLQDHLLTIKMRSGLPQSYYFHFEPMGNRILAFGRLDNEELEKMRKDILSLNQDLNNVTRQLHKKNAELQYALDHVKTLQGIIPICMHCHKIRNDKQVWDRLETYLAKHTDAKFSHSICRECAKKHYPDMDIYDEDETQD